MRDTNEFVPDHRRHRQYLAHAVRSLRERGRRLHALVHSVDERADRLRELGAEVVQGDLLDFLAVSAAAVGGVCGLLQLPVVPALR